jgi:hypothetical protein
MRVTSSLASMAPDRTLRSSDQLRDEGAGIAARPNQRAQPATTMALIVAVTSSAISTTTM